jgi:hypothetical protein
VQRLPKALGDPTEVEAGNLKRLGSLQSASCCHDRCRRKYGLSVFLFNDLLYLFLINVSDLLDYILRFSYFYVIFSDVLFRISVDAVQNQSDPKNTSCSSPFVLRPSSSSFRQNHL